MRNFLIKYRLVLASLKMENFQLKYQKKSSSTKVLSIILKVNLTCFIYIKSLYHGRLHPEVSFKGLIHEDVMILDCRVCLQLDREVIVDNIVSISRNY